GYIWFSTEGGLCRYNGNSIKVYNNRGLSEKSTYNVIQDKQGKIWMSTSKNRLLYYNEQNDSLCEAPFSSTCVTLFNKVQQIYFAKFATEKNLWLCSQHFTVRVNLNSNTINKITAPDTVF